MSGTRLRVLSAGWVPDPGQLDDAARERRSAWPVVLVSMPFMRVDRPSIQLGLLKAVTSEHGFPVSTLHANLDFAIRVGLDRYALLSESRAGMIGDWLFSVAAFDAAAPDLDGRFLPDLADELRQLGNGSEEIGAWVLGARDVEVPAYLDALVDEVLLSKPRVVAFSSTFQQNTASFALARRLKEREPEIVTVFGGANFDGDMGQEWVRAVKWIDLAVVGEGDAAFPAVLAALADGSDPGAVPGVVRRVGEKVVATPPSPPSDRLDDLPIPDYDEYFDRAEALGLHPRSGHRRVWIPFESARGCWWGAKHHCTFCGLNGTTMRFRSKSPQRVLGDLAEMTRRYRSFRFEAVDNILDMRYLTELLPAIVASGADYEIFYEVKANLTRPQLKLLAQAGVVHLQPGLESLSSNVLRLMDKGVRAIQNVNLLRWAQYYGIHVGWNILWGFPGETVEDYAEQASVLPHLMHLRPPVSADRLVLERFSPLFDEPNRFRMRRRTPEKSYEYIYPADVDLASIAYFFDYELDGALPTTTYDGVRAAVTRWQDAWNSESPPVLTYWNTSGFLQIYDGRYRGREGTYTFHDTLADIYVACSDRPITASAVRDKLKLDLPVATIENIFRQFQQRGLMFVDDSLALALALPTVAGR